MYHKITNELLSFLDASPTCFHAVQNMANRLAKEGYTRLKEDQLWQLEAGKGYFVTRNSSAIIAFTIPDSGVSAFRIMASHSDSPTFKIKENPEISGAGHYVRLNTEKYGGMIISSWLDRPLSAAGRIIFRDADGTLCEKLVNLDRDLLMIPNLAIHMDPKINDGYKYNPQTDLLPVFGDISAEGTFMKMIADAAGVAEDKILGHDLFLYNRQKASVWGASEEYIAGSRLDDLQCAFASLLGFLQGEKKKYAAVHCVFDNEEVGSCTKQGAASTFLKDTLIRICISLGMCREQYLTAIAGSFMVSADNAHAAHPARTDKADPVNRPFMNEGIVIKFSGSQKYCTDGMSAAMFKDLCMRAGVPFQIYTNRSDLSGGSTLGNISSSQVALNAVDIGLAQLAMHSACETAGVKDTAYLIKAASQLFE